MSKFVNLSLPLVAADTRVNVSALDQDRAVIDSIYKRLDDPDNQSVYPLHNSDWLNPLAVIDRIWAQTGCAKSNVNSANIKPSDPDRNLTLASCAKTHATSANTKPVVIGHIFTQVSRLCIAAALMLMLAACGGGGGGGSASPVAPAGVPPASAGAPLVPTSITLPTSSSSGSATIRWAASTGATRYELQRRSGSGAWTNVSTSLTGTSYSQTGLGNGNYQYRVRACSGTAASSCSAYRTSTGTSGTLVVTRTTTPVVPPTGNPAPVPASVTVPTSSSDGSATIRWAASTGATRYELQRRSGSGAWTNVSTSLTGTSYRQSGLGNGNYQYRVRACSGTAASSCSAYRTSSGASGTLVVILTPVVPPVSGSAPTIIYRYNRLIDGMAELGRNNVVSISSQGLTIRINDDGNGSFIVRDEGDDLVSLVFKTGVTSGSSEPAAARSLSSSPRGSKPENISGTYGNFEFNWYSTSGVLEWEYQLKTLSEDKSAYDAIQALNTGQNLYEKLVVVAMDQTQDSTPIEVLITIIGHTEGTARPNRSPWITQQFSIEDTTEANIDNTDTGTANGGLLVTDDYTIVANLQFRVGHSFGHNEPPYVHHASLTAGALPSTVTGEFGTFSLTLNNNNGELGWSYDLDTSDSAVSMLHNGQRLYDKLTIHVQDEAGELDHETIIVRIDGTGSQPAGTNASPTLDIYGGRSLSEYNTFEDVNSPIGEILVFADIDTPANVDLSFKYGITAGTTEPAAVAANTPIPFTNVLMPPDSNGHTTTYGSLSFTRDNMYSTLIWYYQVNTSNSSVRALNLGETLYEKLSIVVNDGNSDSHPVTMLIIIHGLDATMSIAPPAVSHTNPAVSLSGPTATAITVLSSSDAAGNAINEFEITGMGGATLSANAQIALDGIAWGSINSSSGTLGGFSSGTFDLTGNDPNLIFTPIADAFRSIADGEVVEIILQLLAMVSGDNPDETLTWTIRLRGADDRPTLMVVGTDTSVTEGGLFTTRDAHANGRITVNDPDSYPNQQMDHVIQASPLGLLYISGSNNANGNKGTGIGGVYGRLYLKADFTWSYELYGESTIQGEALEALTSASRNVQDTFYVRVDGDSQTRQQIVVNVNGADDTAMPENAAPTITWKLGPTIDSIAFINKAATGFVTGTQVVRDTDDELNTLLFKTAVTSGHDEMTPITAPASAFTASDRGSKPADAVGAYGVFEFTWNSTSGDLQWRYRLKTRAEDRSAYDMVKALNIDELLFEQLAIVVMDNTEESSPSLVLVTITGLAFSVGSSPGEDIRDSASWSVSRLTGLTLTDGAMTAANLIATFDDVTDGPAAMRANPAKYELMGIFADPTLSNWNNLDGQPDAAYVGKASVSTWGIGTLHSTQATGSIKIKSVTVTEPYLNFLMAGGAFGEGTLNGPSRESGGSASEQGVGNLGGRENGIGSSSSLGVTLLLGGTSTPLAAHTPSTCDDRYIKGDQHWVNIDISALEGMVVDILIYDHDPVSDCGFIAFDHFYQSSTPRGQRAATATRPDLK